MISSYFNKTAYLKRYNGTINELGPAYNDATYWTTITTISCALQTVSARERFANGANTPFMTHRMYCAVGTDFDEEDKMTIDSVDYDIKGTENVMERGHHLEVLLEQRS
jgi:head-tail adaptor